MASTITADNGVSSGSAGLKSSADSSGVLALASGTGTTAVTIDTSQNVGIGTSSPSTYANSQAPVLVTGTGNNFATMQGRTDGPSGATNGVSFGGSYSTNPINGSRVTFNAEGSSGQRGSISFWTKPTDDNTNQPTERARIDTSGNLLVGTTSPTLGALGNFVKSNSTNYMMYVENTANTSGDKNLRSVLGANCNNTSSFHLVANTGGSDRLYIYGNGSVVNSNNSYGALSDVKLKENITDAAPKLSGLMQVRVVNYNLKSDPEYKQLGVIAQELEQVFPGLVDETPDYQDVVRTREVDVPAVLDEEGNEVTAATTTTEEYTERELTGSTTKSVKYSVFVPMLIKAMQEQQAIITTQQATLTTLTERIAALEAK